MSWHIIYTKCDKGCVSDVLSHTVCRLKALVCLPQIMAMAGGGTLLAWGHTGGKRGPRALTWEPHREGMKQKEPWLGVCSWVEKMKAGCGFRFVAL